MGRLFWKVFVFTILAQLIATLGIGGAIWLKNARHSNQQEELDLSPPAAFMIDSAAATLQYGGIAALRSLLENRNQRHEIFVVDEQNQELLGRKLRSDMLDEASRLLKLDPERHVVRQVQAANGQRYLLFSPISPQDIHAFAANEGPPPPYGADHFHDGPPHFDDGGPGAGMPPPPSFGHFLPFLPIASAVLSSLIFAALLARYFSKTIHSLRAAFGAVASGNLAVDLGSAMADRKDELTDLGRDFDSMVKRLRTLLDGQRRLLHDVSHELRSPLARLQAAIGLARQQPEKMAMSLERIERESMRIDRLVGELLTLSKLEAGALDHAQENISLEELLADIIQDARFEAEVLGTTLEFTEHGTAFIKGNAELLHRAIENVLRNALKHTAAGYAVVMDATVDEIRNEARLTILDRGPGVPDTELRTIFEPFFRSARSLHSTDGHGLGLAIAQRVVASHGGSIRAFNRDGGGLGVEILLPILPAAWQMPIQ